MAADFLLRPDNRLLGWSTGDFSLYGAQPEPTVSFARGDAGLARQAPPANVDGAATSPAEPAGYGQTLAGMDNTDNAAAVPVQASAATPVVAPAHDTASIAPDPVSPAAIDAPHGGSTAPNLTAQPTVADHAAPDGSSGGTSRITEDTNVGHTFDTVAPVLSALAAVPASVVTQVAQAEALVRGATDTIGAIADTAHDAVEAVSGTATDLVSGVDQAAHDALGHVPTLDIDQLIFAGTDPAAGITTLVGLVQTSELFSVGQTEPAAAPDATGSIVDDLAGDAAMAVPPITADPLTDHHAGDLGDLHLGL